MIYRSISEFGSIPFADLPPRTVERVRRFDERHARAEGSTVFDWNRAGEIRATNWVGVVQVPGLTIEILPKIDVPEGGNNGLDLTRPLVQHNLLCMLGLSGDLPIAERDLADQQLKQLPLLESMIWVFAKRLLEEVRRGLDHSYIYREENLHRLRGKLLVSRHVRINAAHRERFWVGFDEFVEDTWLNRIFKATCRSLLNRTRARRSQQVLMELLLCLAEVQDVPINPHDFDRIQLHRNTERFRPLLDFAHLVMLNRAASMAAGSSSTFSLLFPMEKVFEQFVVGLLRRHNVELGLDSASIHAQALRRRRHLLESGEGVGCFALRPDIIIDGPNDCPSLILDTKWKRLDAASEETKSGLSQADLYQVVAYAHRYQSPDTLLLYPKVAGVQPRQYFLTDAGIKRRIRIEFIDLSRDLVRERQVVIEEVRSVLHLDFQPAV